MPTQRIVLTSLLVGLLGVVGCSSAERGTPVADDPPATSEQPESPAESTEPSTPPSTPPADDAPPVDRPKPIDLTTVDICQVLAALPLPTFKLDGDRPPLAGESSLFPGAKDCFVNGIEHNVSLLVVAVTDQGAKDFTEFANVAAKSDTEAAGYPLTVLTPQAPANCMGVLDVHDGQLLYLSYGLGNPAGQPATPQADLCRTVPEIATAVVGALG
ncbi:DUF3558 family protein [Actinophytocola sediminis]